MEGLRYGWACLGRAGKAILGLLPSTLYSRPVAVRAATGAFGDCFSPVSALWLSRQLVRQRALHISRD